MDPTVFLNLAKATTSVGFEDHGPEIKAKVLDFHRKLPHYEQTHLHSLPGLAKDLGLGHVFVKDESNRLGLPSFKILGASWAIFRAVAEKIGLDVDSFPDGRTDYTSIWKQLTSDTDLQGLSLVTCTEGNWGRAVACMAKYLNIPVQIFVPFFVPETTLARIRSEGVKTVVERVSGTYDDSVAAARREAAAKDGAILVMDMGWDGYDKIPGVGCLFSPFKPLLRSY